MNAGKYLNLSNEQYHSHTKSLSRSAIMEFEKSPKKYWANYLNPIREKKESTPAMQFGEQFHAMILEPEVFKSKFVCEPTLYDLPDVGLLKDLGREEYDIQKGKRAGVEKLNADLMAKWKSENFNKKIIKSSDYLTLGQMRDALQANKEAWDLLTEGVNESSYFWEDKDTGLLLKARPDVLHGSMAVDLKTCKDASLKGFQRAMVESGYHIQAAMIIDAVKAVEEKEIINFVNICIEKEAPYSIGIYIIDDAAIQTGREKYKSILREMKNALDKNEFNDYPTQIVGLPSWYY